MSRINMSRVLIGGLVAGLIVNIGEGLLNGVVLADDWVSAMAALNRPPMDPGLIPWFFVFGFGLGFMLVWVYAAIRPRMGPGVGTAVCAATAVWGLSNLYPNLFTIVVGLLPTRLVMISIVWGLVETIIAAIAGAWIYKEAPSP
jgi:hypothetical protein